MRYCTRCILPDTRPNLTIGPDGVCNACHSHASRKAIDWKARRAAFERVIASAKARSRGYDCLVPVSGGKDSHWQVGVCLERGLRVLAVTWRPPARTEIGRENLENLVRLGVDHVDYSISLDVERRFAREAFERVGSSAVPMHMAIFNIPLRIAASLSIPLVVWGENSAFEYGGTREESTGFALDERWLRKYGVTHGTSARDWVGRGRLTARDLAPYFGPSPAELSAKGIRAVFLGYYFPWDPVKTFQAAAELGFKAGKAARTGAYAFADIDDDFISVHHHLKWHKFGFTRTFDNLSLEIRNGRLTRSAAVEALARRGDETPERDIAKFCAFTGMTRRRFDAVCERFRDKRVWKRRGGRWVIPDFLVPGWKWR
ncbi:MAG: N-acetyl sugar amidotransferase [Elusimicrobiota bacterium]|jgi:N-acetyl sugar amidotransferase